jgi:DNA-directed RNA polymerase subunit F
MTILLFPNKKSKLVHVLLLLLCSYYHVNASRRTKAIPARETRQLELGTLLQNNKSQEKKLKYSTQYTFDHAKKLYKCDFCDKLCESYNGMHRHVKNIHSEEHSPTLTYQEKQDLLKKLAENAVRVPCNSTLYYALKTLDGRDLFQCPHCDRYFIHQAACRKHLQRIRLKRITSNSSGINVMSIAFMLNPQN